MLMPPTASARPAHGISTFVFRPGGKWVPVIALDQLPAEIELEGIAREVDPRLLDPERLTTIHFIDSEKISTDVFHLKNQKRAPYTAAPGTFLPPDAKARGFQFTEQDIENQARPQEKGNINLPPNAKAGTCYFPDTGTFGNFLRRDTESNKLPPGFNAKAMASASKPNGSGPETLLARRDSKSLADDIANIYQSDARRLRYGNRPLPPSGIDPDPQRKEYCTHWIRTGECAFVEQGCLYKHEMPPLEKLREIGFMKVPQWWKEKTVIKPTTWLQQRMKQQQQQEGGSTAEQGMKDMRSNPRGILRSLLKDKEDAEPMTLYTATRLEALSKGRRQLCPPSVSGGSEASSSSSDASAPLIDLTSEGEAEVDPAKTSVEAPPKASPPASREPKIRWATRRSGSTSMRHRTVELLCDGPLCNDNDDGGSTISSKLSTHNQPTLRVSATEEDLSSTPEPSPKTSTTVSSDCASIPKNTKPQAAPASKIGNKKKPSSPSASKIPVEKKPVGLLQSRHAEQFAKSDAPSRSAGASPKPDVATIEAQVAMAKRNKARKEARETRKEVRKVQPRALAE